MQLCRAPYFYAGTVALFTALLTSNGSAQTPVTGVRPRATPSDYAVSQQTTHATYAAAFIPSGQVKQMFAADISKNYVVFEVAVYPAQAAVPNLGPGDFLAKSSSDFVRPVNAATIVGALEDKSAPHLPTQMGNVNTEVGVGYETGTDPYTGRRVHGTYTEVGVNNYPATQPPRSGSSPNDLITLEDQLSDRSFPQGSFTAPVAGYLYFAVSQLKKANGGYELQFLNDDSAKVRLIVPTKKK